MSAGDEDLSLACPPLTPVRGIAPTPAAAGEPEGEADRREADQRPQEPWQVLAHITQSSKVTECPSVHFARRTKLLKPLTLIPIFGGTFFPNCEIRKPSVYNNYTCCVIWCGLVFSGILTHSAALT